MSTMKSEEQSTTPTSQSPAVSTPVQSYTTPWPSTQMAIDPALQQQSTAHTTTPSSYYQAYTSHYPQAAYATHYQAYAPPAQQSAAAATTQSQTPVRPATTTTTAAGQYQTSTYNLGTATSTVASAAAGSSGGGGMDTADIATLNDALGSAGVDLRAEEETLQRTHDSHQPYRAYEDRTRKQPPKPAFDTRILSSTMRTLASAHKVTRIPDDSVNYLALALRARLQDLVTAMIGAAHHRTDTQFDRPASVYEDGSPMWSIVVRSDVAKQLAVLERVEREEEMRVRKERRERAEMTAAHAAALAAQANGMAAGGAGGVGQAASSSAGGMDGGDDMDGGGGPKKKRKKDGPGVTARNMSEDVRKKMSNAVATQAAGLGGRYAWMNAANAAASPAPKPKRETTAAPTTTTTTTTTTATPATTTTTAAVASSTAATTTASTAPTTATSTTTTTSTWARPYVSTKKQSQASKDSAGGAAGAEDDTRTVVTMRDAMFVIEKERGHGGGRGAARGWV